MNDLPNELLISIFEYLKVKDLIQCSLVCKRFKLLCQAVKTPELIISSTNDNVKGYWFYTKKQFNLQDAINVTTFNSYRSRLRLDKFRRLYFEGSQSEYAQLKVNDLTQLEQVKINVKIGGIKHETQINLPNVKMVEFDTASHKFFITTPKLEMLRCNDFDEIHLTHPNSIKHLETNHYSESLPLLQNLQFLLVEHLGEFDWSNTLSDLPKLTSLLCNGSCGYIPRAIKSLVEHKLGHQRSEPKIYFLSVELDELKKIDEYTSNNNDFLFQINNYNSLTETVFNTRLTNPHQIDYNTLVDSMKDKVPDDFFKKYFSTRSICVNGKVENQEHLFEFLKNFDYLTELQLYNASLDQSFYSRLGELDQLTWLTVATNSQSPLATSVSIFNFDCLLMLKRLTHFYISFDSINYFDLTLELFTHLKYFESGSFNFKESKVFISKNMEFNNYKLRYDGHEKCRLDFNGLIREVEAIKNRHINQD
ncbi:uncharacterized protein LOC119083614 [Bradysia coprophila]|uniref:uncharacterized protein LOC119083614 n=1 Tax=Bradysia coprophila TaxID=38358 RepID=UPI00187D703A|nr:uncharacterized protein LOC119083614 [Bradysia coprophila]